MAIQLIDIPDSADAGVVVALGTQTYTLRFQYLSNIERYKLDIIYNGNVIAAGFMLIENIPVAGSIFIPDIDGVLLLTRLSATTVPAGRNNIGVDSDYVLAYIY